MLKNIKKGLKNMRELSNIKVIGCSGYARSGKDTFCSIANDILNKNGIITLQYSFASALKKEVEPFLRDVCKCDVWTSDTEIKTDMRDFLVWYGTTWWRKRDPKRWIRNVDLQLKKDKPQIALISDVRYPNEAEWVHSYAGFLVHISAYKMQPRVPTSSFDDGPGPEEPLVKSPLAAPNEQERINDPKVKKCSDYCLEWELKGNSPTEATNNSYLRQEVLRALNSMPFFNVVLTL